MTSNQMRRIEEERLEIKHDLEISEKREQELQSAFYEAQKELCKLEAKVGQCVSVWWFWTRGAIALKP